MRPAVTEARLTAAVGSVRKGSHKSGRSITNPATRVITYNGLQFSVPADWPVYRLKQHPDQCIRYDINAVYVGTPGANQNCPAGLIGRADTISIGGPSATANPATRPMPATAKAAATAKTPASAKTPATAKTPAKTELRALLEGQPVTDPSVIPGTIVENPDLHEFAVAMPASLPWIEATYGTDPELVEQTLDTIRATTATWVHLNRSRRPKISVRLSFSGRPKNPVWPKNPTPSATEATVWAWPPDATTPTPTPSPAVTPTPRVSGTSPGSIPGTGSPSPSPVPSTSPSPVPSRSPVAQNPPSSPLAGFDTCTAPSLATMKAWRARYAATAIYIGGQMMACDYGNLSASWVRQTEAMGWSLMPTFVGLQAPCNSFSGKIDPSQAAGQGTAAANQAIGNAASLGLGAGSPVYYDMEAYDHTNAGCRTAVLAFLDAWDRQLRAKGYVSGVYSSADAAVTDLQSTTTIAGHALAEPQAIWFALWDNATNLTGSPYLNSSVWPQTSRSKQYAGNQTVTVGGISLNIDADLVHSAVARG